MKKITRPQTKPAMDREAVRVLAIELGAREAARRLGLNRNTVISWARRYNWNLPKRAGRPGIVPATDLHTQPGDVLLQTHKELGERTRTGLAQATARAAEAAAKADKPVDVSSTSHLRDLAASAARVFGWDNDKKPPGDTYNTLVVTTQQLEQIRALREPVAYETPGLEGPPLPFPYNPSGPVDGELRITS
jgi:transposase